jgi:hypothetical protein
MNFVVESGSVFLARDKKFHSDLMATNGCHSDSGACITPQGTLLWNAQNLTMACPYVKKGVYSGSLSGQHVVIDQLQMAGTLKGRFRPKDPPSCVSRGVFFETDQGMLIRFIEGGPLNATEDSVERADFESPDDGKLDAVNAKLQFLNYLLRRVMRQGFHQIWLQLCHAYQQQLDVIWQILRIDATLGARAAFQRQDIVAEYSGDALRVTQCRTVNATRVIWSHKLKNVCYTFTPVIVGNTTLFLIPGTRELQLTSPTVDCTLVPTAVYKQDNVWTSSSGGVAVHRLPMAFVWRTTDAPVIFEAPPLFDDGTHGIANLLLAVHDRNLQTQLLASRIDRLVNYTAAYSMDPTLTRHVLLGIGEGAEAVLKGAGSFWNATGHAASSIPSQLLHGLLLGPLQWLLNAALITAGVLGVLYLLYLVIRWRRTKRALSPFSDPLSKRRTRRRTRSNPPLAIGMADTKV